MRSKLTEGWEEVELGEIADFLRGPFGSAIKKSVCVPKGKNTYKVYEQGNIINNDFNRGTYYLTNKKFEELKKFELLPGDIAITCAGTLGKIAIVPDGIEKGVINSVLMRIRVNTSKIIPNFFIYFFRSPLIQNKISSQSQGVALKNLFATKKLRSFRIVLPQLSIQKKIVSKLEKAEKLRQKRGKADKLADEYIKAVFWEMFLKEKDKFLKVELGDKELFEVKSGGTPSKSKKEYWTDGNIPWIGSTECKDKPIYKASKYITQEGLKNSSAKLLPKDTILVALVGATIGKTGILDFECSTNQNIAGIIIKDKSKVDPDYLFLSLQKLYSKFTSLSSETFKMANLSFVRSLKIPLPPLKLQKKFASIVKNVEKIKEKQKKSKKDVGELFNALMQKAFRGELAA